MKNTVPEAMDDKLLGSCVYNRMARLNACNALDASADRQETMSESSETP